MANGITVDISARIVGYEASIKQLQAALAKVDPGSDIGKKISQALSLVEKQSHDLSKNMFPKASSEGQVDAIVEKVNRLGASIQNVAGMFSSLSVGDLNLKALGPEINDAINQINKLQSTISSTLNGGIQEAVTNSDLLSSVFKELGINVKELTVDGGKIALAEGMAQAAEAAAEASNALENAKTKVTELQNEMNSMKSKSPFLADDFNITTIIDQFNAIKDPSKVIDMSLLEKLKSDMLNNLSHTNLQDKGLAQQFIENMFGQIDTSTTLENFKLKLSELRQQLTSDAVGLSKNAANGVIGTTGDGTQVFNRLLGIDQNSLEASKIALRNLIATFNEQISSKDMGTIIKLIDNNKLERAADVARKAVSDAFDKVIKEYKKKEEELGQATQNQVALDKANQAATTQVERYTQASNTYNGQITALEQQVTQQRAEIANLQTRVEELTRQALGNIQSGASGAGASAGKNGFPLNEAKKYKDELGQIHSAEQFVGKLQGVVQRWFSVYAAVRMVSNAIKKIIANTKELDATITEIAIVTNMDQDQLWGQMPKYIEMAKQYGASISGAYKVSQLYYQQGLGQSDVMALSEQTLKMARISGLDYAQATDYMTNAVRSFKLEMTDAVSVVDTYSAVAAASATSVTELATAMSKTASSAQSVGSSLQNTTAMMAVMIEATRESPENIGSAMKSIISRYGELKENKTGIDEEGEEYSLNKVDTALQAVGISIHDAKGEFRDFDDVIFELSEHWNEIDKNTQRYIATVMAGNRQQSRFLALVSSGERLKELSETAADSEDASQMQYLKTLDSIEYKSQQMQNSLQSLYANEGVQNLIKDTLDSITNIIDSFNAMSSAFDTPIAAIAKFGVQFANIARIVTTTFGLIKTGVAAQIDAIRSNGIAKAQMAADQEVNIARNKEQQIQNLHQQRVYTQAEMDSAWISYAQQGPGYIDQGDALVAKMKASNALALQNKNVNTKPGLFQKGGLFGQGSRGLALAGLGLSMAGSAFSMSAMNMGENTPEERSAKAWKTGIGSVLTGAGMGAMFGPIGIAGGALVGLVSGVAQAMKIADETAEERTARLKKELETAQNENISKKNEFKTLKSTIDEYEKLKQTHLDSAEAAEQYQEVCNKIAEEHPDLISGYDAEGNAIVNLAAAYNQLKKAKEDSSDADKKAADAAVAAAAEAHSQAESKLNEKNIVIASKEISEDGDYLELVAPLQMTLESSGYKGVNSLANQIVSAAHAYDNGKSLGDLLGKSETQEILEKYRNVYEHEAGWEDIYKIYDNLKGLSATAEGITKEEGEVNKTAAQVQAKQALGASSITQNLLQERLLTDKINNTSVYSALSDFTNASTLASRYLTKQAQNYEGNNYFVKESENDFDKIQQTISKFWANSFTNAREGLDQLIQNQGNYTQQESKQMLSDFGIDENGPYQLIYESVMQYYENALTNVSDFIEITAASRGKRDKTGKIGHIFTENLKSIDEYKTQFLNQGFSGTEEQLEAAAKGRQNYDASQHWMSKLGENERQIVSSFYNNILEQIDNKTISEETGIQVSKAYVNSWKALTSEDLIDSSEIRDQAQQLLKETDFTDINSVQDFITGLSNLGLTLEHLGLTELKEIEMPINFAAKVQTFGETMSTQMTSFEKDMTSITKGMSLEDASKMASKLNISLNKFRQEGNKFFLDDYNLLQDYYFQERNADIKKLKDDQDEDLKRIKSINFSAKGKIDSDTETTLEDLLANGQKYSEDWQKSLNALFDTKTYSEMLNSKNINPAVLKTSLENYMKSDERANGQDFISYLEAYYQELYNSYVEASSEALKATIADQQLQSGDITGFLKTTGVMKNDDELYQEAKKNLELDEKNREKAEEIAANKKQEYLDSIASSELETNVETLKQQIYDSDIAEGKTFQSDLQKRAEAWAKVNKATNEAIRNNLPASMEDAIDNSAIISEIKADALEHEGLELFTHDEAVERARQIAEGNAEFNKQFLEEFYKSDAYAEETISFSEWKEKNWQKTGLESSLMDLWQNDVNSARRNNEKYLDENLKDDDFASIYGAMDRQGLIINDQIIRQKAQARAAEVEAINAKFLETHLLPEDAQEIYESLLADNPEAKSEEQLRKEAEELAKTYAAANDAMRSNLPEEATFEYQYEKLVKEEQERLEQAQNQAYSELIADVGHGEIDNLPEQLREFAAIIYKIYGSVQKNIMSGMMEALKGGESKIEVTTENKEILKEFQAAGLIKRRYARDEQGRIKYDDRGFALYESLEEGDLAEYNLEELMNMSDESFTNLVEGLNADRQTKSNYLRDYFNIKYPDPSSIASKMITSSDYINRNELEDLYDSLRIGQESDAQIAERLGLETDEYGALIKDREKYIETIQNKINLVTDPAKKRELEAELASAERMRGTQTTIDTGKAVQDLIKSTDSISEESRTAFEKAIGTDKVKDYLTDLKDGTHKLDVVTLRRDIINGNLKVADAEKEAIMESFAQLGDQAISAVEQATQLITSGTNKQEDIQKIVNEFNGRYTRAQLFSYNEILDAYTFNAEFLQEYQQIQAKKYAEFMGVTQDKALQIVSQKTQKTLASQVDISGFLSSETRSGEIYDKLIQNIENYYKAFLPEVAKMWPEEDIKEYLEVGARHLAEAEVSTLKEGGAAAVTIAAKWAARSEKELTSAEIESVYRAQISQIEEAMEQLEYGVGSIVSGEAIKYLEQAGYNFTALDANNVIIETIGDISVAYQAYYDALKGSGEATLAAINEAKAKVLETKNGRAAEQAAIEALGDASGMTYTTFGAILSEAGIEMTDTIVEKFTESLGGGKLRIKDFASFARAMNWDYDSEEYTSAFKSYNDALIERNKQVKESVYDEVSQLKDIKPGEWLNLTYTVKEVKKFSKKQAKDTVKSMKQIGALTGKSLTAAVQVEENKYFKQFGENLAKMGALLDDGILQLTDDANLLGVAQVLQNAALEMGTEMSDELADMVQSIIQSYTEAINKGIDGGLTSVEKSDLIIKARDLGVNNLDFTESAEGLKLTTESAIRLYTALSETNALQKKVTFNKLKDSLTQTNSKYKDATSLLTHIQELSQDIQETEDDTREGQEERIRLLKQELGIAKEILATKLIEEDQSWDFMGQDQLPSSIDNAITYWESWASGMNSLDTWAKDGKVDMQQFSSMLKHVMDIANATGQTFKFMGKEIGNGEFTWNDFLSQITDITTIDKQSGKAYFSAEKLRKVFSFDMKLGAKGISKDLQNAVDEYVQGNADMLKSFETFYGGLSEISKKVQKDRATFLDENGDFDANKFLQYIKDNKDVLKEFNKFAENVEVDGETLKDALDKGTRNWEKGSKNYNAIKGIYKMMLADDWDTESGYQTIAEHLSTSGFEGKLTMGDMEFEVRAGKVITHVVSGPEEGYYAPDGTRYEDAPSMWKAIHEKELAEYKKEFATYHNDIPEGQNTFTLPGNEWVIQVEGDHFIVENRQDKSKTFTTDSIPEIWDQITPDEWKNKDALSENAYEEYLKTDWDHTQKGMYKGHITSEVRSKIQQNNYSAQDLENLAKELWDENSGLTGAQAATQFKIKTGIDLDPKINNFNEINWEQYINESGLTQAAADVMSGVTEAFTGTGGENIAATLGKGIADALTGNDLELTTENAESKLAEFKKKVDDYKPEPIEITINEPSTSPITDALDNMGTLTKTVNLVPTLNFGFGKAAGTVGSSGNAQAKGTLMGELGPELVVSKGRYFVVGQTGPEMVDLAPDAIVFNHLQTQSLLTKGTSSGRGRAITDERTAVAYAKGSKNGGPAREGGDTVSNALDKVHAAKVWDNISDTAFNGTSTSSDEATKDLKAFIKELERWYNWLQRIAYLEKQINYEEALRTRLSSDFVPDGKAYYESQVQTLKLLQDQLSVQKDLNKEREKYLKQKRQELASDNNPFSALLTFDPSGQPVYKDKKFEEFSHLSGADRYDNPNFTAQQQYEYLTQTLGVSEKFFEYDKSGNKIDKTKDDWYVTAMQAYWEKEEKWLSDYQTNFDDWNDGLAKEQELSSSMNEILHEIEDNQISLENRVLEAIEDAAQREIDELKDQKEAIQEANQSLIDGLTRALDKERDMYEIQDSERDLETKRRRLAILQRTGGSAAEIASLSQEIDNESRDLYFEKQQQQIDAIQEASDLQIEKLDAQIAIMEETLQYEKEHGLLWNQVYEIMAKTPEEITSFITTNNSEFWAKSATSFAKDVRDVQFEAEQWKAYAEYSSGIQSSLSGVSALLDSIQKEITSQKEQETEQEQVASAEESQAPAETKSADSGGGSGGSDNSNNNGNNDNKKFYKVLGETFTTKKEAEDYLQKVRKETRGAHGATSEVKEVTIKSSEWQYDDSKHWKLITYSDDTTSKTDEGPHNFDKKTGACICGYTKAIQTTTGLVNAASTITSTVATAKENAWNMITSLFGANKQASEVAQDQVQEDYYDWLAQEKGITSKVIADSYKFVYGPQYEKAKKQARGGYVNHGLYELGELGTETVLNASQTKVLRDNILSNRPESLINLLRSYNESYHNVQSFWDKLDLTKAEMNDNYGNVVIEHAEVNLQIDELANDYDARRAANTVMDELLQIARKTSAQNRIGR